MKALVILNPAAGKKSSEVVNESLRDHFSGVIDYEVYETKKEDKTSDIVRARLGEGFDLVVAAGGDGTVSAVIGGVVGESVPLGIVPVGTGNMLARELNLPLDIDKAVALIASAPQSRKIDVMSRDGQTCVVNASVGFSAAIISDTSRESKNHFGRLAYYWTAARKIFGLRGHHLEVEVDGNSLEYHSVEVIIVNCGKFFKTLYPMGPEMSLDDGHLDVWILSTKSELDYPLYILGLMTGRPANLRTDFLTAKKNVTIRCPHALRVQVDGDAMGTTPLQVELLPGALTVLVSEKPEAEADFDDVRHIYAARFPPYFRKSKPQDNPRP